MKVLVTGCAGFIGSNFIKWLIQSEPSVSLTHLDALTYAGNLESIKDLLNHPRHTFVKGDIRDQALTEKLLPEHELLINFAAESHVDRSIEGPRAFVDTNVMGTLSLLEAARKVGMTNSNFRFVQVSTDEVYGSLGAEGAFTEETPLQPNSPYSSSKAASDLLVRAYFHTYGMKTITTRCSNNYGPYQFPEKLIPLMILNAQADKPLPVYGDGLNVRDWIHVTDHNRGVWAAATKGTPGEVYNLGSNNEWPNIQIVKNILKLLDKPESLIKYVKDRPGHDRRYAIDARKAHIELGWKPEIPFDQGLRETVDWYRAHAKWIADVQSGEYQRFYDLLYKNLI